MVKQKIYSLIIGLLLIFRCCFLNKELRVHVLRFIIDVIELYIQYMFYQITWINVMIIMQKKRQ